MSNRNRSTRKHIPTPAGRPIPAPPIAAGKPYGPGHQKGQQAARQVIGENPSDEHADIIRGFKAAIASELMERAEKVTESLSQINNALKALDEA